MKGNMHPLPESDYAKSKSKRIELIPNPDYSKAKPRSRPVDPLYTRYASVRYRSKKKNMPFNLTQELIQNILNQPCVYCGEINGIQLDRKIGEDGYTVANVVPACKRCNTVKSMYLTHGQMMIVAKALGWTNE